MKIRNINLKAIEARRYLKPNERPKQVRIDHNSSFTRVTEDNDSQGTIEFQYTASYGSVGMIKIEGSLIMEHEDVKKIVNNWNDSKKMPNEIASHLHTAIMHACVPEAVGIAKDLTLPPPIPLPQVKLGQKPSKAEAGPEVA
jgi:hypothetical protein